MQFPNNFKYSNTHLSKFIKFYLRQVRFLFINTDRSIASQNGEDFVQIQGAVT